MSMKLICRKCGNGKFLIEDENIITCIECNEEVKETVIEIENKGEI